MKKYNKNIILVVSISVIILMLFISYLVDRYFYIRRKQEGFESSGPKPDDSLDPTIEMKKYNVIFVGTVRSVEKYMKRALENVDTCGKKFNDYAVIIYENDSSDKTREILQENKKDNYHYIFEDNITESRRTMRIANGRNQILDKIKEINENQYYNYMIVVDMDDINDSGTFVDTIDTCFKYDPNQWDVLTGNQTTNYYDLWALRKKGIIEGDFWGEVNKIEEEDKKKEYTDTLFPTVFEKNYLTDMDSAFGGIAIYKLSSIPENCRYVGFHNENNKQGYPADSEQCEHVEFNECIKKNGGKLYINTEFFTY
jgi:hypothetical protein